MLWLHKKCLHVNDNLFSLEESHSRLLIIVVFMLCLGVGWTLL